jgi:hypothetical protein
MSSPPTLSKSRFLTGLQCPKALWLTVHQPDLAAEMDPARQAVIEAGNEVGRAAHELFPGGVLVDEPYWRHEAAVERTRALVADPAVPAIFEAAFEHAGVRIRVDVLERLGRGGDAAAWGLREVKASAGLKEHHVPDVAVQRFVLEGAGLAIPSVELVHVNGEFVRGEGPIDWRRFFTRQDVTEQALAFQRALPRSVGEMRALLGRPDAPAVEPSGHCFDPWECGFWAHCTAAKPPAWHLGLKRASEARRAIWLEALATGRPWVAPELAEVLADAGPPAWCLDFETVAPAIPLYPGTRPYEALPFLYSLHRLAPDGSAAHADFLADGRADPRPELAARLVEALSADDAPILVWSGFEARVLRGLAEAAPALAPALDRLRARIVDLLAVVRAHAYHPGFAGSYSLKDVAPALAPGFGYGGLEQVTDGAAAATAFARLAAGAVPAAEADALRAELRAYCARDTQALVEVHRALRRLAGEGA